MAQRTQLDDSSHPLHEAYACLLTNGLDGAGEALRILVKVNWGQIPIKFLVAVVSNSLNLNL